MNASHVKSEKQQVSVNLDIALLERLKKLSKREHRTLSAQIAFILAKGLTNLSEEEADLVSDKNF